MLSAWNLRASRRTRTPVARLTAGLIAAAIIGVAVSPAHSEGFFEALFGGLSRARAPAPMRVIEQPVREIGRKVAALGNAATAAEPGRMSVPSSRGGAFCVRACDGRYFPVEAQAGLSVRHACNAMCPSAETKVFYGRNIDKAVTDHGLRYTDIPNAFAYRKQMVPQCTCNGRTAYGLAKAGINDDPTLRKGDIVATSGGLAAYTGRKNETPQFTPVENYSGLPRKMRESLSEVDVAPDDSSAAMQARAEADAAPAQLPAPAGTSFAPATPAPATAKPSDRGFSRRWVVESAFTPSATAAATIATQFVR